MYRASYRPQEVNHCPSCGNSQWMIGRMTAECAFCATALPLVAGGNFGNNVLRKRPLRALAA
ncbi:hypothetical protein [Sphingomonas sp. M1-B02]|uniref:hypothetical protein n=1 Tax=Sphingomonas sp. M1-B02 TaxID=3114300 RepID=UPI002240C27E|nr:hypothetical protein [Sphingomonas sp. S6-11]UZK66851.1 hypothetical protein OKW87_03160 [Sphingomonas sp. S6-11]